MMKVIKNILLFGPFYILISAILFVIVKLAYSAFIEEAWIELFSIIMSIWITGAVFVMMATKED